jgi:hypothetical protein
VFTDLDVSRQAQSLPLEAITTAQEAAAIQAVTRAATGPGDLHHLLDILGLRTDTALTIPTTREGTTMTTPATETTRPGQPSTPAGDPIEQLLGWADAHTAASIRTKAARIRDGLHSLRERRAVDDAQRAAEERVARLRAELDQAQQDLKAARNRTTVTTSPRPAPVQVTSGRRDRDAIRAWARAHGHPVADRGVIPQPVLDAYTAAHSAPDRQAG